ncbi:integrase [Pseudomonas sp. GL-B-16]|uniref:integrase n=1 Tax=Pseudomonas sp. GL-B-16 TaxID=2832373 RepID=UPI001CBBC7F0|nr:integrase [Pseudomonas sp. GL-B-16]
MADILFFIPKHETDAKENLNDFITLCRDKLTVFGVDLDWNSHSWAGICSFRVLGALGRTRSDDQFMSADFIEFAKAYVRYKQGLNPTTNSHREIAALRCIEKSLLQTKGKGDVTLADHHVFDCAAEIARETQTSTAYLTGIQLAALSKFLSDSGIIPYKLSWKSPISSRNAISKTNAKTLKLRPSKLPTEHCLEYMAEMFANDLQVSRDRFITSIFALLMCAPSRISEILDLPIKCLHPDLDKDGNACLGLRFYGAKGYGSDIKYIPTDFKDIATEAVHRLTELSAEGRKLAKWYEENPDKFYRHSSCPDVGEHDALTSQQACAALGLSQKKIANDSIKQYFKKYKPYFELCANNEPLTLSFLNTYCHSQLPKSWPWKNKDRHIKFSDALFCFGFHQLREDYVTSPVLVWTPSTGVVRACLRGKKSSRSIWERHGYRNPDNSAIEMNSHQVRHFLNTAAQRGSLGQLDIARWSGRANIHQNFTYNHMTDDEYVDQARLMGVGSALEKIKINAPVTFADLESVGEGIAHVTEYGFCVHDFSMLPCQKYRDCLNCSEQVCIKGDVKKLERLKRQRSGILLQLKKSQDACEGDVYGADRWSQHQRVTLERVDQLIHILERSDTPDGSIIKLNIDDEFSPLKREIAARTGNIESVIKSPSTELADLDEIRLLMEF